MRCNDLFRFLIFEEVANVVFLNQERLKRNKTENKFISR